MNYYVYVIRSLTHGTRYVGSAENIQKRLKEHNDGRCRYTSGRRPWKLEYFEELTSLSEARQREMFLKSGKGRLELDQVLKS